MGNSTSVEKLVFEIRELSKDLQILYNNKYLSKDFCNNLELIYDPDSFLNSEHIITYEDNDHSYDNTKLGYIANVPELKIKVCQSIQRHYNLRIQIIQDIVSNLDPCIQKARIDQDANVLQRCKDILQQFKDFNEDIDDEMLNNIQNEVSNFLITLCRITEMEDKKEEIHTPYGVLMNAEEVKRKIAMKQQILPIDKLALRNQGRNQSHGFDGSNNVIETPITTGGDKYPIYKGKYRKQSRNRRKPKSSKHLKKSGYKKRSTTSRH